MILSHITAMSQNRVIGTQNTLPWNIPEDMKFFRSKTKGHIMIMGRKTFESLGPKPLPNRFHLVISRQDLNSTNDMVKYVKNLQEALVVAKSLAPQWGDEIFIVGGGEIYAQSIDIVDKIYLTVIHQNFAGDTYYPEVPLDKFTLSEKLDRTDPIPFSFLTYTKKV